MVGVSPAGGVCWARAAGSVRKPSAMTRTAARRARYMTISLEDREHTTVSRRLRRRIDGESETEKQRRRRRRLRREREKTSKTEGRGDGGQRERRSGKTP